jgi:hypothetical protein
MDSQGHGFTEFGFEQTSPIFQKPKKTELLNLVIPVT